jgi:hypothetical protein
MDSRLTDSISWQNFLTGKINYPEYKKNELRTKLEAMSPRNLDGVSRAERIYRDAKELLTMVVNKKDYDRSLAEYLSELVTEYRRSYERARKQHEQSWAQIFDTPTTAAGTGARRTTYDTTTTYYNVTGTATTAGYYGTAF